MLLDGSNAENKISLLVILCIIMYVKKKKIIQDRYFFFSKPIMVKCLNIGKNIGQPIYRSISNYNNSLVMIIGLPTATDDNNNNNNNNVGRLGRYPNFDTVKPPPYFTSVYGITVNYKKIMT